MKVFQLTKSDGNSSLSLNLYLDGTNEENVLTTGNDFLAENKWCHVAFSYNTATGSIHLYKDGELTNQVDGKFFTGTAINSRFSSMILGGAPQSFSGHIDDLRVYKKTLSTSDIENIFSLNIISVTSNPSIVLIFLECLIDGKSDSPLICSTSIVSFIILNPNIILFV